MAPLGRLGAPLVIFSQVSGVVVHHKSFSPDQPSHAANHSALVHHKAKDPDWDGKSVQEEPKYSGDYPIDDNKVGSSPKLQPDHVYSDDYPKDGNGKGHGGSGSQHHAEASSASTNSSQSGSSAGAASDAGGSKSKPPPPTEPAPRPTEPAVVAPPAYRAQSVPEFSPASAHSAEWYESRCSKIKAQCEERREGVSRSHRERVHRLEKEYKRSSTDLDRMEDRAEESEHAVDKQKTDVKNAADKAKAAAKTFEETKNCPKELRQLEDELEKLESEPNDSDSAIDEECQKKKEILKKEQCVERYLEARSTLARRQAAVGEEADALANDRASRDQASDSVQPYKESTDDAKTALDRARANGASGYSTVDDECSRQLKELEHLADREVKTAEDEYRRHKDSMDNRKHQHEQTEEDVAAQKQKVEQKKVREEDAQETYDRLKDCPAELEKAERELRELEAMPNDSDEAIDAECEKKKVIMRKRRCVDEFSEARDVLTRRERAVAGEKQYLARQQHEERVAQSAAGSYEDSVRQFKQAWEDAKAARRALKECAASESESSSTGGTGETKKGDAGMMRPTAAALLVGPLLAMLLQHTHV